MKTASKRKITKTASKRKITKTASKKKIFGVDFGTGKALQIWGPRGIVSKSSLAIPRIPGGKTPRDEFINLLEALLKIGDVVIESPTVGSSGAEKMDVLDIVNRSPNILWTVSARAVKNYRRDHGLSWDKGARYAKDGTTPPPKMIQLHEQDAVHVTDAKIIYLLATKTTYELRRWHIAETLQRKYTSVRPMDKRNYRDANSNFFMAGLPRFSTLPADLANVLGVKGDYSRSMIMPFAMALHEPHLNDGPPEERRKRFMKILGPYADGYPSFYRRMTVVWMQTVAKEMARCDRFEQVSRRTRTRAWKITQKQIRHLFHLCTTENAA